MKSYLKKRSFQLLGRKVEEEYFFASSLTCNCQDILKALDFNKWAISTETYLKIVGHYSPYTEEKNWGWKGIPPTTCIKNAHLFGN